MKVLFVGVDGERQHSEPTPGALQIGDSAGLPAMVVKRHAARSPQTR
ncbi:MULTISPECIES: hypothetical protein [Variovorax]|nr:hypothetical protein [Variovorax sp. 3319]MDR6886213.1 hypothetical protein [Variovorax sp. 3319]